MLFCEILELATKPSEDLRQRHIEYLKRQGTRGNLVLAGRFSDVSGGLLVWNVSAIKRAEQLARNDPYVTSKIATFVLKNWLLSFNYTSSLPTAPASALNL